MIYKTSSTEQTKDLASKLAPKYQNGGIIALSGPLGAGKTTFVQGFAKGLGVKQNVISPTFIVMRQYPIPQKKDGRFFHIDLYRLDQINQLQELGLSEIFANPNNIILIEWAEKLGKLSPSKITKIYFNISSENTRQIEIKG